MSVKLPAYIDTGFKRWKVADKRDSEGVMKGDGGVVYGVTDKDTSEIFIYEGPDDEELNTVIHECCHAALYSYGHNGFLKQKDEEKFVTLFGNVMTELLLKNPALLQYINKKVKEIRKDVG